MIYFQNRTGDKDKEQFQLLSCLIDGSYKEQDSEFEDENRIYIADGHHRAASAVKVGLKMREENPGYTGEEEFNFFLSVLFPESELKILPYNRVVKDLKGMSKDEFFAKLAEIYK